MAIHKRRRMKAMLFPVGIAIALSAIAIVVYPRRFQIWATLWHWKHGKFVAVGNYEVPVPEHWLVYNQAWHLAVLVDTATPSRGTTLHPNISISLLPKPPRRPDLWMNFQRQRLKNEGIRVIDQRTLTIDHETVYCIGGSELADTYGIPNTGVISLQCQSTGTLSALFTGSQGDTARFYAIVQGIHRK